VKKVMVIEVQVAVAVKPEEDFAAVNAKVTAAALTLKEELGDVASFNVLTREIPVKEE